MNKNGLKKDSNDLEKYDIFRDSNWRYMGYANEIGEAFRPLIHRQFVNLSYAVAITYVLGDVCHKAYQENNSGKTAKKVVQKCGDVFFWQMFASVLIPGVTINRITSITSLVTEKMKMSTAVRRVAPTSIGLLSIPFIVGPIDKFVDYCMDKSYREYFK